MSVEWIIVNGIGVLLILFVLWWFFGSKPKAKAVASDQTITILVKNGVYDPAYLQVPANKTVRLKFIREDTTACSEILLFSKLNLSYQLPVNQSVEVIIPPQPKSEIEFTCQMGMYRGKIIVE